MQSWGYFGQYTSSMKKLNGYFLIPISGQASGSRRCWKMQSQSPGIQSFEAVNKHEFWVYWSAYQRESCALGIHGFEAFLFHFWGFCILAQEIRFFGTLYIKKQRPHQAQKDVENKVLMPSEHTSYSLVSNERFVHYISNDTPQFNFDWMVWSQCLAKVEWWFLAFSSKWQKIPSTKDNFSRLLFSNYCHSVKNLLRATPTANGHKYPKLS